MTNTLTEETIKGLIERELPKHSTLGNLATSNEIVEVVIFSTELGEKYATVITKGKEWKIMKTRPYYAVRLIGYKITSDSELKIISVERFPIKNTLIESKGYLNPRDAYKRAEEIPLEIGNRYASLKSVLEMEAQDDLSKVDDENLWIINDKEIKYKNINKINNMTSINKHWKKKFEELENEKKELESKNESLEGIKDKVESLEEAIKEFKNEKSEKERFRSELIKKNEEIEVYKRRVEDLGKELSELKIKKNNDLKRIEKFLEKKRDEVNANFEDIKDLNSELEGNEEINNEIQDYNAQIEIVKKFVNEEGK